VLEFAVRHNWGRRDGNAADDVLKEITQGVT
jgi:hypothetical protein